MIIAKSHSILRGIRGGWLKANPVCWYITKFKNTDRVAVVPTLGLRCMLMLTSRGMYTLSVPVTLSELLILF